jgi:hypothetical protein
MGDNSTQTGPHRFRPLGRVLHRDKCAWCYLPASSHPVRGYTMSRPYGDKT